VDADAGVVDDDLDAAVRFPRRGHGGVADGALADVAGEAARLPAASADLRDEFVERRPVARHRGDRGALARQP
jgi:hypothetical protein